MAKLQFSGIGITGISGKLGGTVIGKNGVARVRVSPANPQSATQLAQRALISSLSTAWQGLTEAQRVAWDAAASSGEWTSRDALGLPKNPTGHQLYVTLNANISTAGGSAITAPPLKEDMGSYSFDAVTVYSDLQAISITLSAELAAGEIGVLSACPPVSAGRQKLPVSQMRFVEAFSAVDTLDPSATYLARFGAFALGQKIWFKMVIINSTTGQTAVSAVQSAIAVSSV